MSLRGLNLRNLRSKIGRADELSGSSLLTGAVTPNRNVTPLASVSAVAENNNFTTTNTTATLLVYNSPPEIIHLAVIFCNVKEKQALKWNFRKMTSSLIGHSFNNISIHFHLVTDPSSLEIAKEIIHHEAYKKRLNVQVINNKFPCFVNPFHILTLFISQQISAYFIETFAQQFGSTIEVLQQYFSAKPGTYYSQALFYVSVRLPDLIPLDVDRLIFVDVDTEFRDNLTNLYGHFEYFTDDQLLGLAPELSPVYRHILYLYRNKHKATLLGEPKGMGFPGFNSGVVLMKLAKMRQSSLYSSLVKNSTLSELTTKYSFKGHLGDQDFYTLIALEYPQLFYTLPCNWNRQLCQWWKSKGYDDIFDFFYECKGFISLYHGNCNSVIPKAT